MFKQGEVPYVSKHSAEVLREAYNSTRCERGYANSDIENAQQALAKGLARRDAAEQRMADIKSDMMRLGVDADAEEGSVVNAASPFPPPPAPPQTAPYAKPWGRT